MNTTAENDPSLAPVVQALRDAAAMGLDRLPDSVVCKHCGCKLRRTISTQGVPYWASNSGNAYCIWPMQHMRHEATA